MDLEKRLHGLSEAQVAANREKYGKNEIEEPKLPGLLERMLDAVKDPILGLLIAIATIILIMSFFGQAEWYESVGTYIAVVLVSFVSARTGMTADNEYRKLKESTKAEPIKVYRDGVMKVIDISEVVYGDIVLLQSGDKIPADGILVDGKLTVDNSSLNGEAEECKKFADSSLTDFPSNVSGETLVDKTSLFKGTTVYGGEGYLEVKRVGMKTMMGEMAADMAEEEVDSPLKVKLGILAGQISKFGYIGAIVIAVVYMVHFILVAGGFAAYAATGFSSIIKDVFEAASVAIIIVVCAVPEGLPLMIALVLQANASKMLKMNVLVRKAIGIETAGSLNVLFSDKTGTITKGKLDVVDVFFGDGSNVEAGKVSDKKYAKQKEMIDICIGKNTSALFDDKGNVTGGNVTDQALLRFLGRKTLDSLKYTVDAQQGFNSANKFSQSHIKEKNITVYKGAPERLLAKATKYLAADGKVKALDLKVVNDYIDKLADRAMRVLAFGYSEKELVEDSINDDVVIVGFVGIRDDVRPEAKKAIQEVQDAGIQVVMITGDRLATAVAIGKESGLLTGDVRVVTSEDAEKPKESFKELIDKYETVAISSDELNKLDDDTVKSILNKIRVIARALPKDKSRMVKITQQLNLVCGMTGDGVNDSPALKRADVGFAMGSGTEAAKEAGDLVIIDDNFMSIRNAILYGRTIYHNILKFVKYQLSINVGAVLVSSVLPFIGIEEPLTVTQLLFVNLVMDSLGALLLGQEPAMQSYMKEKPRRRDENIVSKNMFLQFCIMGVYLLVLSVAWFNIPVIQSLFATQEQFKTGFFAAFMFASILNGFNVRNEGFNIFKDIEQNGNFFKVLISMLAATVVISEISLVIPLVGEMFSTQAFGITGWLFVIIAGLSIIPVDMLRKLCCGTYKTA